MAGDGESEGGGGGYNIASLAGEGEGWSGHGGGGGGVAGGGATLPRWPCGEVSAPRAEDLGSNPAFPVGLLHVPSYQ